MYCIKCGVELADSEKVCPLCGTRVFHPDLPRSESEAPFPADNRVLPEDVNRSGVLFILTALTLLPAVLCIVCDWRINGSIVWSGYAAGGVALLYITVVLPLWFRHPNPAIFVPVDFAAIALFLLYINFAVGGHWFLSFAFPVTGAIALLRPRRCAVHLRRRAHPHRRAERTYRVPAAHHFRHRGHVRLVDLPADGLRSARRDAAGRRGMQAAAPLAAQEILPVIYQITTKALSKSPVRTF